MIALSGAVISPRPRSSLGRARQEIGRKRHPGTHPWGPSARLTALLHLCRTRGNSTGRHGLGPIDAFSSKTDSQWQPGGQPMRRLVLALLAGIAAGFAGAASAADLTPAYKAPPAPPPVVDPWTGFYVGVNGGYSWGPWDSTSIAGIFPGPAGFSTTPPDVNGWVAGIQGGYNWRINNTWLAGLEADIQATGERDKTTASITLAIGGGTTTITEDAERKFPWFATFRGRVGALIDPSTLIYLTGGLAVGHF